jgi:hypothetical protein
MSRTATCLRHIPLAIAVLLLPACAGGRAAGGGGAAAGPHVWPAGTTAVYQLTGAQTQQVEIPGGGQQVLSSTSTIDLQVAAAGARAFTVTFTGGTQHDDAADLGAPVPDISLLPGLTSQVRLDDRGLITEATGLAGNAYVNDSGGVDPFREQNLQLVFQYLPEGPLEAGTEWSRDCGYSLQQLDGTLLLFNIRDHFTCVEATEFMGVEAWRIQSTSEVTINGSADVGVPAEVVLSGGGESAIHIARGTCMVLANEWKASFGGAIMAQGMEIPVTITQVVSVTKK